jgi:hypothetical protein
MSTLPQTVAVFAVGTTVRFISNFCASEANTLFNIGYAGFRAAYIQVTTHILSFTPGQYGLVEDTPTARTWTHLVCATIQSGVTMLLFKQSPVEAVATGVISTAIVLHPQIRDNLLPR